MQGVRGLRAALNANGRFQFKAPEIVVDHLVIGGGVVGLSIVQRLCQKYPDKTTFLVERHSRAGEETSSRNSEVIHSGLYYPSESLKTQLCLRGRSLLYDRCISHGIPHKQTGKLVVATESQRSYVETLHRKCQGLKWPAHSEETQKGDQVVPTELISDRSRIQEMEPDLSEDIAAALWVPTTGIVDSDDLMKDLEKEVAENGGDLAFSTRVVRVDPSPEEEGWVVQTVTGDGEQDGILARTLINAGGLAAPLVLNAILSEEKRLSMYYARGSYASYKGPGVSSVKHLIYPCPGVGKNAHAFASLGTHLTLDLNGKIKFGPDIEWISPPDDSEDSSDFWAKHLVPDESRLPQIHEAVTSYLPGVTLDGLQPDYVGIRPKLVPPGAGFEDFVFRTDFANPERREGPLISCLGIESPGLTSGLAIGEYIVEDIMNQIAPM